jgi:KAP family P-loop domain
MRVFLTVIVFILFISTGNGQIHTKRKTSKRSSVLTSKSSSGINSTVLLSPNIELQVGYEPVKKVWYHTFYTSTGSSGLQLQNLDIYNTPYLTDKVYPGFFQATEAILDTSANPVFFGGGPFIEFQKTLDSIPEAANISVLVLVNNRPAWALIRNSGTHFLYQKAAGSWSLNPVIARDLQAPGFQTVIGLLTLIMMLATMITLNNSQGLRRKIKAMMNERKEFNPLLTKSEKPLGIHGEDLLGFATLEDAITRIIRNPQLELPMTIVVSGTWGSGKSSMMNRVKEKLETDPVLQKRFMTTWFNAWHLEGESSLLNAFLLNIIDCYERYYAAYSAFRLQIAVSRYIRLPFWKKLGFGFAIAVIAPFILLIVLKVLPGSHPRNWDWVNNYCTMLGNIFFSSNGGITPGILTPIGAGVIILSSILFLNRQFIPAGLSAFFELIPKNNFKLEVEKADIGTREKFRQQYWEIMAAGRKGTRLVVFIDDLDRIGGDKILELLEGINFISDIASRPPGAQFVSPNTIFVLGMYTQEVARLVGTQLKKVNGSELEEELLGSLYVEKMVQLIVPVPFDMDDKEKLRKLYEN